MGCIYESRGFGIDAGACTLCDEDNPSICPPGAENGICICSDDPDPGYTCDSYESDDVCLGCGADLNVEECQCEEEED